MQEPSLCLDTQYLDALIGSDAAKSLTVPLSLNDRSDVFQVLKQERRIAQGKLRGKRALSPTSASDAFSDTLFKEAIRRDKMRNDISEVSFRTYAIVAVLSVIFMSPAAALAVIACSKVLFSAVWYKTHTAVHGPIPARHFLVWIPVLIILALVACHPFLIPITTPGLHMLLWFFQPTL